MFLLLYIVSLVTTGTEDVTSYSSDLRPDLFGKNNTIFGTVTPLPESQVKSRAGVTNGIEYKFPVRLGLVLDTKPESGVKTGSSHELPCRHLQVKDLGTSKKLEVSCDKYWFIGIPSILELGPHYLSKVDFMVETS